MDYASFSPNSSFLDYAGNGKDISSNVKYKKKYIKMKRLINNMVFENAALCDQVSLLQEKVMVAKEERRFLLKKMYHFSAVSDTECNQASKPRGTGTSPPGQLVMSEVLASPGGNSSTKKVAVKKAKAHTDILDGLRIAQLKPKKTPAGQKPKKYVQHVLLDVSGRPVFPIFLGGLTVYSLGEVICDKPNYYTEDLIFPVGFCSTRVYGNFKNPEQKCTYTCKVLDGGASPRFEIVSDTDQDIPIQGSSANQCHATLLKLINNVLGMEVVKSHSKGPEFFGFSVPTIHNLIQSSLGARKCPGYKATKFEMSRSGDNTDQSENDASLSYDSLVRNINFTKHHLSGIVIKKEPPDPSGCNSLRDLLKTT